MDLKRAAVLLVCGGLRGIIFGVEVAGDRAAIATGNPEVRASGIEDNFEGLRRRAKGDLRVIYSLSVIAGRSHKS
jgi:hypothetical protein